MTLICNFKGQLRSNLETDLNSQHMVSYLLPIQYGHLTLTVWHNTPFIIFPRMDDLDLWVSSQLRSKVKTDLNSQHMVSYLLPIQYGHLSLTVWPQHAIYRCFRKWMTSNYKFQGQLRSKVKTDLNSQHMGSYLLPIQYGHLTLTIWPRYRTITYLRTYVPTTKRYQ